MHLGHFGKINVLLITHGHGDPIANAPALAPMCNVPVRGPGGLPTQMTLCVLPRPTRCRAFVGAILA